MPEFFALLGIDIFLAMSLTSSLLDKRVPIALPYIYQIAALAGFGHMVISREFRLIFGDHMRFWYCLAYLAVALNNVLAVNVYLAVQKKLLKLAEIFLGAITLPTMFVSVFFISSYANHTASSLPLLPHLPLEAVPAVIAASAVILGIGILVSLRTEVKRLEGGDRSGFRKNTV